jgi:hypothetical protein
MSSLLTKQKEPRDSNINFRQKMIKLKIIFALFLFVLSATNAFGESKGYTEYKIKAGYIYNFARFIKWPERSFENAPGSFQICLIEGSAFETQFQKIEGKTISGKKLTVKRLNTQDKLQQCQILFIPSSEKNNMSAIIESLGDSNVLTVGDVRDFHLFGGMVSLIKKADRIKLEINLKATKRKGLQINAKLLEIATIVDGD